MKNTLTISLFLLFATSAISQNWNNYFGGKTIYHIDKLDSLLLVGVDNRVVAINITTGETEFLMPPSDTHGNCIPYMHVAINDDLTYWIAASSYGNGLFKYEDSVWQQYTSDNSDLPDDTPSYLYMDHNTNTLWVEFGGAMGTFDGNSFNDIGNYYGPIKADNNGNIWIAENMRGLIKYDGVAVTVYDTLNSDVPINNITQVTVDTNGLVWFSLKYFDPISYQATYTIGTFDGTNWMEYSNANSNLPVIESEIVKLDIDPDNSLVIATSEDGLIVFDGTNVTEYNSSLGNFPDVEIISLLVDEEGTKWIGTTVDGLIKMQDSVFISIPTADNPMPGSEIHDVMVDKTGKVWAGVDDYIYENESLVIKDDTSWTVYRYNDGDVPGSAFAFCQDNAGNVYAVGITGLYRFDGAEWHDFHGWGGSPSGKVGMDADDFGNIWIGTSNALIKCNGSNTTSYYPPGSYIVQCVSVDDNNNIWVGTNHSILRFDGYGNWITYDYTNTIPALMSGAKGIAFDKNGNLWAAGEFLLEFDGSNWYSYEHPAANDLTDVTIDAGGNKWMTFVGGMARFDGTDWIIFNHSNSPIIHDNMYCISIDIPDQTIWAGSYCGGIISLQDTSLIVGVNEYGEKPGIRDIRIYPNPSSDLIKIRMDGNYQKEYNVMIFNISGQLMYTKDFKDSAIEVNISNYPKGIYMIKLTDKDFIKVSKLIKL